MYAYKTLYQPTAPQSARNISFKATISLFLLKMIAELERILKVQYKEGSDENTYVFTQEEGNKGDPDELPRYATLPKCPFTSIQFIKVRPNTCRRRHQPTIY